MYEIFRQTKEVKERWSEGKTMVNHWHSAPGIVNWDGNTYLGGEEFRDLVLNELAEVVRLWIGRMVNPSGLYGVRVYKKGAMLSPREFLCY